MLLGQDSHTVSPEEPLQGHRFIRQPSNALVAIGVSAGVQSREDAETEPRRLKHRLNRCKGKQGVGLTGG